ncbi:TM2 domain-containing protein [Pseudovibrio exalbescens]|uniref:TM2 domain-containing protein n=1 Tax=Pseudovibrio exalbescens TaxID=197461 RepID=UPI0023669C69|nr:TM2 domain-containing protein [Pseudovibrio exalbescens]MDD7910967.1 TM2 domain-containing protein [Pseudovibrio exalbescens]
MSTVPQAPLHNGWSFCTYCGQKIAFAAPTCPKCGAPQPKRTLAGNADISPKSYGVSVTLCGVFGMIGIHHFYMGNIVHGLVDLGLFLGWLVLLFVSSNPSDVELLFGFAFFIADFIHTSWVFILLICGKAKDGKGRLVAIPSSR